MNVILLHGFGENASIWDNFIPLLDKNHKYFTPDFSKKKDCFSIPEYAEWLHKEFEKNGIKEAVIIGHSMGGYIAIEACHQFPDKIIGLGMFHSTAAADSEEKKDARDKTIQFLIKHDTEMFIRHFYPNMFSEAFKSANKDFINNNIQLFSKIPNEALLAATIAMKGRRSHFETLKELSFPVFQIIGVYDTFVTFQDALSQSVLPKKPNVLLLDDVAHAGMLESPQMCADFINNFLSKIA